MLVSLQPKPLIFIPVSVLALPRPLLIVVLLLLLLLYIGLLGQVLKGLMTYLCLTGARWQGGLWLIWSTLPRCP
eukprot:4716494-Karenia_brevis.AAC.1